MEFKDVFREKYRIPLMAARLNDAQGVIEGLNGLVELCSTQFEKNNGVSIVVKAKLSHWKDTFAKYASIVKTNGLKDIRVQKLFGLVEDDYLPSIGDILNGGDVPEVLPDNSNEFGADIDGLLPKEKTNSEEEKTTEPITENEKPVSINPYEICGESKKEKEETKELQPEDKIVPQTPEISEQKPVNEASCIDEKPLFTPNSLRGFIGQAHIVKALLKEIAIAKTEGRKHLDNIMLFGNPGLGKTTLIKLIAAELGVKFELLDCSQFRNSQQSLKALQNFFLRIGRDNEPVVIALDEVHMLNKELQSSLLTLLNDREYISPLDVNGKSVRIKIDEFTFIAATTDDQDVLDTIKNRCLRLTFQMVDYTTEELKQIYKNKISAKGLTIDDEVIDICIPRSRGAIRYVNSIVEGLNVALYNDEGQRLSTHITLDIAKKYFEEKGIDDIGLGNKDLEILNTILQEPNGVISVDVLSARVGMDSKKYMSEYEKYLMKIGFISVNSRGRSLTEKAKNYLKGENKND